VLKTLALIFGVVLLAVGIMGFVPSLTPDMKLLGLFHVDELHNIVHLASGAAGLLAGLARRRYAKLYFQVFGLVYGLVTISGLLTGNALFAVIPVNMEDNILHLVITAVSLYLGFVYKTTEE
jgi:hypothetical protein